MVVLQVVGVGSSGSGDDSEVILGLVVGVMVVVFHILVLLGVVDLVVVMRTVVVGAPCAVR